MLAAIITLLVWTGPHTPCVWARPYDGEPPLIEDHGEKRKITFSVGDGLIEHGPDRQSATVCELPVGERSA
jgi:hypothetical protein